MREFNRRNRVQIQLDDPAIAAWHVCCVFDADNPEEFARLVVDANDSVRLVREGPDMLRIVPREAGAAAAPAKDDAL